VPSVAAAIGALAPPPGVDPPGRSPGDAPLPDEACCDGLALGFSLAEGTLVTGAPLGVVPLLGPRVGIGDDEGPMVGSDRLGIAMVGNAVGKGSVGNAIGCGVGVGVAVGRGVDVGAGVELASVNVTVVEPDQVTPSHMRYVNESLPSKPPFGV
jgi:hypothetical protein